MRGSGILEWYSFDTGTGDELLGTFRGKWLWDSVQVAYGRRTHWAMLTIFFPLYVIEAVVLTLIARIYVLLRRERRRVYRTVNGLCSSCGYDLRGTRTAAPSVAADR